MEAHKNNYAKNEDSLLWEIHEIRHELHSEIERKGIEEINCEAKKILESWKVLKSEKKIKSAS